MLRVPRIKLLVFIMSFGAALLVAAVPVLSRSMPQGRDAGAFFESRLRPLLIERCFPCHSAASPALRGGLRLDSRELVLKGGGRGAAATPGDPDHSLLIRAIRYEDSALRMPPGGRLRDEEIAALVAWVKDGAVWPVSTAASGSVSPAANRRFWAYVPPRLPALPAVRNRAWATNPIDRFILAQLEAKGLKPAPPADKRTLIRRATFDLTGLPPTPEEVDAFLKDTTPDAYRRVVDRLLASPAYGERWGRHWLDVARYADSNGLDENLVYTQAWRYRDYVIRAFNQDKPIDRFIQEQVAGDLLPPSPDASDFDRIIATGYLAIGAKMLAEDDPVKQEMDLVDEQVDTLGKTFLGLTLGCARCHDHKFDPFPQTDYYALASIFKSTKTMAKYTVVAEWQELPLGSKEDQEKLARIDGELAAKRKERDTLRAKDSSTLLPGERATLKALDDAITTLEKTRASYPRAMSVSEGKPADLKVHQRGNYLTLGAQCSRGFPAVLRAGPQPAIPTDHSGRLELARWMTRPENPLTARVFVNRVWRWHFGRGIVPSTDNFGTLGDRPANQPLLDWLAVALRDGVGGVNGVGGVMEKWSDGVTRPITPSLHHSTTPWSLKDLHRLIMLSNTYQMSSRNDPKAAAVDPENRLHWRADRRRLEAEEIRDSILAVSGALDRTMGGTLLTFKDREYVTSTANADPVNYRSNRRSVYLPVIRSALYDVYTAFDFGDPTVMSGDRPTTTVAPQALFMMNSPLVLEQTKAMATTVLANHSMDDAGRIALAYEMCFGRPVTPAETRRALEGLRRLDAAYSATDRSEESRRLRCWQSLCKTLIGSSEFIYVD